MPARNTLILWFSLVMLITGVLAYALPGEDSAKSLSTIYLPGETTHGHYQIELKCGACHTPMMGVREEACIDCHGQALKEARDTHPKSKFRDPVNAKLLEKIDAGSCLTCHAEHVPHRTHPMGVTVPNDYCIHCHEDVSEDRPSHQGMSFQSCATAGCHNYHDNLALYEKYLDEHHGEPSVLANPSVVERAYEIEEALRLALGDADAPGGTKDARKITRGWSDSLHARAGVNCTGCHGGAAGDETAWSDQVDHVTCETCHPKQVGGWLEGKHGMRIASGLTPMEPAHARLPMHQDAAHRTLDCQSCHASHEYDTRYAAVDACLKCHADEHSLAYVDSSHHQLWKAEQAGTRPVGSGVSCATCHLPRMETSNGSFDFVQHNQNINLEPNEKMVRSVCFNCHGLEFSLDALADPELIRNCYSTAPSVHVESVEMAHEWFESRRRAKERRKREQ